MTGSRSGQQRAFLSADNDQRAATQSWFRWLSPLLSRRRSSWQYSNPVSLMIAAFVSEPSSAVTDHTTGAPANICSVPSFVVMAVAPPSPMILQLFEQFKRI